MTPKNVFGAFKGDFVRLGMDGARESSFIGELNKLSASVEELKGAGSGPQTERTIIVQQVASSSPSLSINLPLEIVVNVSSFLQAGQLVHYYGTTLEEADATANKPANWIVRENTGSRLILTKLLLEGYVLESGGSPDGDLLYTYTGGGTTRRKADLVDGEGNLVGGVDFIQVVGVVNGKSTLAPRTNYVVGSLNFLSEVG